MSCRYLAHHELESVIIVVAIITAVATIIITIIVIMIIIVITIYYYSCCHLQPSLPGAGGAGAPAACGEGTTPSGAGRSTGRAGSPARSHAAQTPR